VFWQSSFLIKAGLPTMGLLSSDGYVADRGVFMVLIAASCGFSVAAMI